MSRILTSTRCLRDILRQPDELRRCLEFLLRDRRRDLERGAATLRRARAIRLSAV